MKLSEYQKLPNNVRAHFSSYSDDLFDDHPQVIKARRRIAEAETEHQKSIGVTQPLTARYAELEARLEQAKIDLQTQREARQQAVVSALVEGREIPASDHRSEILAEAIEALPIALGVVEKELFRARQIAQHTANAASDAGCDLERVIEHLKLDKARRASN